MDVRSQPRLPAIAGAHELAWSYLLDEIFADAYHAGVQTLRFVLPASLHRAVSLRGALTPSAEGTGGTGIVLLAGSGEDPPDGQRIYSIHVEHLVPRPGRRSRLPAAGWTLRRQVAVYTWRAVACGMLIRFFALLGRPALVDRSMAAMRHSFTSDHPGPAYYRLAIWSHP